MTAEQRAELLKHVTKQDLSEKISYRDCEKVAKDLNLTLEQVGLFQAILYPHYQDKISSLAYL